MNNIGAMIREKRIEAGFSQKKLADEAGLCLNTIGILERKNIVPKMKTLKQIADALDIDIAVFIKECEL